MSCTGLCWAVVNCHGLYWAVMYVYGINVEKINNKMVSRDTSASKSVASKCQF